MLSRFAIVKASQSINIYATKQEIQIEIDKLVNHGVKYDFQKELFERLYYLNK